jgi:pyruvate/2-oxoglutarate dehydrogenase complex dihydrolipoamide dehydrogenase (E3) component
MVVLSYSLFVIIYQSLAVIGGGTVGLSVASCMKELGCDRVTIIERNLHCLMDMNDIDKEIAAYIESTLIRQQIDIITNCFVNYITEAAVHSITDPIKLIKSSNIFEFIW